MFINVTEMLNHEKLLFFIDIKFFLVVLVFLNSKVNFIPLYVAPGHSLRAEVDPNVSAAGECNGAGRVVEPGGHVVNSLLSGCLGREAIRYVPDDGVGQADFQNRFSVP